MTTPSPHAPARPFWIVCSIACLVGLSLDQATKVYAESVHLLSPPVPSMAEHQASSEVLFTLGSRSDYLDTQITHVANAGVMLGALEEAPHSIPLIAFFLTSALALAACASVFRIARPSDIWLRAGAAMLATGVVGNMLDRLRLGYVVDWLHLRWSLWSCTVDAPAFNFADLFIVGGAMIAAAALAHRRWATRSERRPAPSRPA